jgi:uncharacterized protein (DUF2141 family)
MRKYIKLFLAICLLGFAQYCLAQTTTITININSIRNSKGTVKWAVYNKESNFISTEAGFADAGETKAKEGSVTVKTKPPPDGTYAISIFHDENNNSEIDFNFFGLPIEGFGFSQNPTLYFGPPKFKECTFVKKGNNTQSVKMKYYL